MKIDLKTLNKKKKKNKCSLLYQKDKYFDSTFRNFILSNNQFNFNIKHCFC